MTWSLDRDDRRRLVHALMQIESMRDRNSRDLCIGHLEQELGFRLSIIRNERDRHDIWSLVDGCLTHPGGIHALVSVLDDFHRGSRSMQALRDLVEELLPEPLLTAAERRDLRQLVSAFEAGQADKALAFGYIALCQRVAGPVWPLLARGISGLHDVIGSLEDMPAGADQLPPLLIFAGELADQASGLTAAAIRHWMRRVADRLNIDQNQLLLLEQSSVRSAAASVERRTYLVIECLPDAVEPDHFVLTAWLQSEGEPGIRIECADEPLPLTRLPVVLGKLLAEDQRIAARQSPDLTIEFVLPRDLFCHRFDQIMITVDGLERRLGIEYPVVLRSLDRLRRPAMQHHWRRNWKWLKQNAQQASVCWLANPGDYRQEALFTKLSEHPSTILAMAFPPWGAAMGHADELWVGLHAGTAIVAWSRDPRDLGRFVGEARDLFASDVLQLPERVLQLRRQAVLDQHSGAANDHLGLHLALVFDDADRIPEPYQPLRPPA